MSRLVSLHKEARPSSRSLRCLYSIVRSGHIYRSLLLGPGPVLCIYLSVFSPVPHCLDYCSFRGSPEVCWHLSSNFLFVLLSWVGYLASFVSLWKQVINIPRTACWEGQLICDRDTQITREKNENKLVPQQLDINKPKKKEKEPELNTIHNSIYKINPDWIRDLSGKHELVKHFRR